MKRSDETFEKEQDVNKANKIFEVSVIKANGLKRGDDDFSRRTMKPFFSFNFYNLEFISPSVLGSDPKYGLTKRFEIEDSEELQEYMKT